MGFATVTAGVVPVSGKSALTGKLAGLVATGAVRSLEVAVLDQDNRGSAAGAAGGAAAGIYPRAGNRCRTAKGAESGRAAGAGQSRAAGQLAGGRSDDNGLNADKEDPMNKVIRKGDTCGSMGAGADGALSVFWLRVRLQGRPGQV